MAWPCGMWQSPPSEWPSACTMPTMALLNAAPAMSDPSARLAARVDVRAVAAGHRQVGRDKLDGLHREGVAHGVLLDGRVRLDGMRERVHAGGGRELRRQRRGERRVEDGRVRHQLVGGERQFRVLLRVGHHGHERHLAAGAGRGGHGDERRQVGVEDLRALQRGEVHPLAGKRGGRALRSVDDRAAADGHEPVAAALRRRGAPPRSPRPSTSRAAPDRTRRKRRRPRPARP